MMKIPSDTLDLIYHETKNRLERQIDSVDSLDTKASNVFIFVSILIGLTFTHQPIAEPINQYLFIITNVVLLLSAIIAFFTYNTVAYRLDPDPRKLMQKYGLKESDEVKKQMIYNFIESFETNYKQIRKKAEHINYSMYELYLGLILLIINKLVSII